MPVAKPLPPVDLLREWFTYDPVTGKLFWRKRPGIRTTKRAGDEARLAPRDGYLRIKFQGSVYMLHRIAWAVASGEDPGNRLLDHKDGNTLNNSWSNLRIATPAQNSFNNRHRVGLSGVKGVTWAAHIGKWRVRMKFNGAKFHKGYFGSLAEAEACARETRTLLHGDFACHEGQMKDAPTSLQPHIATLLHVGVWGIF